MVVDAGAYATAHHTPRLKVEILGLSKEEHKSLTKKTPLVVGRKIVGKWMDTETAFPNVTTFYKEDGKLFVSNKYKDGSGGAKELEIYQVNGQTRYKEKVKDRTYTFPNGTTMPIKWLGDYFIIMPDGRLGHGDKEEGIWATSKRME